MIPARRARKRRHLLYYLEVRDPGTQVLIGHVGDLTQDGMLLLTERPLVDGAMFDVDIAMPDVPGLAGNSIIARCTVRWTGMDKNPDLHTAGCQFEPLGPVAGAELDAGIKAAVVDDT
jgi:hypothetical protein